MAQCEHHRCHDLHAGAHRPGIRNAAGDGDVKDPPTVGLSYVRNGAAPHGAFARQALVRLRPGLVREDHRQVGEGVSTKDAAAVQVIGPKRSGSYGAVRDRG